MTNEAYRPLILCFPTMGLKEMEAFIPSGTKEPLRIVKYAFLPLQHKRVIMEMINIVFSVGFLSWNLFSQD